jgi:hypothetical protein
MSEAIELLADERAILCKALICPLLDPDRTVMRLCLNLQARGLLQRAGGVAMANGWRGSPHAFILSRQGWNLLKAERRRRPIRRIAG